MPVVDDLTEAISRFADVAQYGLLKGMAEALWWLIKATILLAYQVNVIEKWLTDEAFPPLIESSANGTHIAASMMFVIALMVAGLTYMLALWIRLDVVTPRKAMVWFLAGMLFFQFTPQIYASFHNIRTSLANGFFVAGLDGVTNTNNPFAGFSQVRDSDPLVPYDLCDNYGPYFTQPTGFGTHNHVRGTDVVLAFLRSHGYDVMGYAAPFPNPGGGGCGSAPYDQRELPQWWLENEWAVGGYFYEERNEDSFGDYGPTGRRESIENAALGVRRLVGAIPLVGMGVVEALIYLLLTLAEGLVFLSFGIALVFSYFNRTEVIALAVLDQMLQLIVQTAIIALMQSLIMGLTFAAASGGNAFLLLGMGGLALIMMSILLWSGVKMVFNSFSNLFEAMSKVTGGAFVSPNQAVSGVAGMAAGAALVATGAGVVGAGLIANALQGDEQDSTAKQRALRGATQFFRAGTYAAAAGTGNSRIAQLGQMGNLLGDAAVGMFMDPSPAMPPPTAQPSSSTPAGAIASPEPANGTAQPSASRKTVEPVRQGQFQPDESVSPTLLSNRTAIVAHPSADPAVIPAPTLHRVPPFMPALDTVDLPMPHATARNGAFNNTGLNQDSSSQHAQTTSDRLGQNSGIDQGAGTLENVGEELEGAVALKPATMPPAQSMLGTLQISQPQAIASVLGATVEHLHQQYPTMPPPYQATTQAVAQAMGVTPVQAQPLGGDVSALSGFLRQAWALGLSGPQTQGLVQAVQNAPQHQLPSHQQAQIVRYVAQSRPLEQAQRGVDQLLQLAQVLPPQLSAYGVVQAPPSSSVPSAAPIAVAPAITVTPIITMPPATPTHSIPPRADSATQSALKGATLD